MKKKGGSAIKGIVLLVIGLVITYLLFECQIKTHSYKKEADKIKGKLEEMKCDSELADEDVDLAIECNEVIKEHNEMIKKWVELPCVDIDVEQLLPEGENVSEVEWVFIPDED